MIERRRLFALSGGLAVASLLSSPVVAATGRTTLDPSVWHLFKARYLSADGRVVDTGNADISHSEGQGYGLLLATAANDRAGAERLHAWTNEHLRRDDGLYAWRWEPESGSVTDPNNATDGDILIAWGLLRGAALWSLSDWREEAAAIIAAVRERTLRDGPLGPLILPGLEGFEAEDRITVNPSYWVFPAFDAFAVIDGPIWREVIRSGLALIEAARFGDHRLPTDWVDVDADGRVSPAEAWPPVYGWNAVRLPLYLVWGRRSLPGGDDQLADLLQPLARWYAGYAVRPPIPATVDVLTGETPGYGVGAGAYAMAALAQYWDAPNPDRHLPPTAMAADYYQTVLAAMSEMALAEAWR